MSLSSSPPGGSGGQVDAAERSEARNVGGEDQGSLVGRLQILDHHDSRRPHGSARELVVFDERDPSIVSTLFFLNAIWRLYALLLSLLLCCGDKLYTPVFILFIESAIVAA